MAISITTLRHARTEFNDEKRYAGSIDIPLSEQGRREAEAVAVKMKDLHFDLIVTSKLRRTHETAKIITDRATPLVRTSLCNERCFGIMEGLTWEDVQTIKPPILMVAVGGDLHTVNPPQGEPFEQVWDRAKRLRQRLFRRYPGQKILLVSHGVFLQMFHGVLRGSNCIESLATYPANLELRRFDFTENKAMVESVLPLNGKKDVAW